MWASVAGGWGEHADAVDERGAVVSGRMLELAAPRPGERVLELACGPGGAGIAAAPLVAPDGQVVMTDIATEMTEIAARRAAERGLTNVTTRVRDLDAIDEPDESFDVVLCREGLMFANDHAQAVGEVHRVLRPGGRVAVAVWGPRDRNPWLACALDSLSEQLGMPIPPPGVHGPFSLDDADLVARLLSDAKFSGVVVHEQPAPLPAASFDAWWARTVALAGPLAGIIESLPDDVTLELRARARRATEPYATADGYEFPGVSLIAGGTR
jgi:enediyne biosynthesis protein CalE5